ncbi:hypothetical protein BN2497_591 [Janthinobacterium sp. CG23_2]|nr:hypothetical protein BN2497_591 [Janthinobacterium sp. CG23_2]CUU26693.1 hypothetical protein BN3177_591 [Janthinobacterium sp. CG23_2]
MLSSIKVAQDELRETPAQRRARPFLDHFGIDLRDEAAAVRSAFDRIPAIAGLHGDPRASQGQPVKAVFCCHVSVAEKSIGSTRRGRASAWSRSKSPSVRCSSTARPAAAICGRATRRSDTPSPTAEAASAQRNCPAINI